MPKQKLKSKAGAKKRFKFTANGKIKRHRANHRHILECQTGKIGRRLRSSALVAEVDIPSVKRMVVR